MTRPTSRVLAVLDVLQSGGTHPVPALAERLGVNERTVRRYVAHLVDLDIPVESVRGRYGGYRLAPAHRMPPLMLSDDEALALMLGLVAGQRSGLVPVSPGATDAVAAKLRRVLPRPLARKLDAVLATTAFTGSVDSTEGPTTRVLLALAEAARERHPVLVGYTSREGVATERTIRPYGLVAHSGRWYVAAADSISDEVRTFRLDRISNPRIVPVTFGPPEGFDPVQHVLAGLAGTPWRHDVSLLIDGPLERIRAHLPASLATVGSESGAHRVRVRAEHLDWIPGVLAAIDLPFVIEGPEELHGLVAALGQRLIDAARR